MPVLQGLGQGRSCADANALCLLWEHEARRMFMDCLPTGPPLAAFDEAIAAALSAAGLEQQPGGGHECIFSTLDLDRLPVGRLPYGQVCMFVHARHGCLWPCVLL